MSNLPGVNPITETDPFEFNGLKFENIISPLTYLKGPFSAANN